MKNILLLMGALGDIMRTFWVFFVGYALIVNLVAFAMYAFDKRSAIARRWRTPESHLICVALLGGSVGAFIAMQLFRHKTKHLKFTVTVPLLMVVQIVLTVACLIV